MVKGQRELVIMLMREEDFQQITRKVQGWKPLLPLSSWAEKFVMSSWLSIDRRLRREVLGPWALVPCDSRSLMVTGGSSRHSTHRVSFWLGTWITMGSGCVFESGTVAYGHDRVALLLLFLDIL